MILVIHIWISVRIIWLYFTIQTTEEYSAARSIPIVSSFYFLSVSPFSSFSSPFSSSCFSWCALMFSPAGICVCICVSAPRRIAETKNGSFYPPCFPISPTVRPNPPFSKCCSQMFGKSCPLNLSSNSLETSSQTRTCLRPSALLPFPSLQIIQTPLHSIIVL